MNPRPAPADDALSQAPSWPYLASAAVLTDFAAHALRPMGGGEPELGAVGSMLMEHGEPIRIGPAQGRWTLSSRSREAALAELARTQALAAALNANRGGEHPDNPTQRAMDRLIESGAVPVLGPQPLSELLGLHQAIELLGAVIRLPPGYEGQLAARIAQLRLLEPLRRLLTHGFAGRKAELRILRSYVDELEPASFRERLARRIDNVLELFRVRPLLVIWGPGGVGKSTLVAKFLLDHAGPQQARPVPFVYLDCDQNELNPHQPISFLSEALRQIQVQFPDFSGQAARLGADSASSMASEARESISRSAHFGQSRRLRAHFADLIARISTTRGSRVLFVIDTFEVVQRRGATPIYNVLTLAAQLMQATPQLRIVVASRACLSGENFPWYTGTSPLWKELALKGFDAEAGRAYLQRRLAKLGRNDLAPAALDRIVALVRGNPLSLRLGAQIFARSGVRALEDAVAEAEFDAEFTNERLQGLLHNRIIQSMSERVRKVADPGLIVRRLTPEIIEKVLNEPCGLGIVSSAQAEALFDELKEEITLFDPIGTRTLRHRPDVRLLMLPLLREELGEQARAIDRAAVHYWSGADSPEARAEELYHLLWLEAGESMLEAVWGRGPVSMALLEETLDEFEELDGSVSARTWLCRKLDREISAALETKADQVDWERSTEQRTRSLLASGSLHEALAALRGRAGRTPASPLWELEIETLKLLARDDEALALVERALERAAGSHAPKHVVGLLLQKAWLRERAADLAGAAAIAARAAEVAARIGDPGLHFEVKLTQARLGRMLGGEQAATLRAELAGLLDNPVVKERVMQRPALLREATAEIGVLRPDLFIWASSQRGTGGSDRHADASSLITVGVAYAQRGDLDQAQQELERARDIASELDDDRLLARALLQLANVYLDRFDPASAVRSLERVLALAQRLDDPVLELQALGALGNVHVETGEFRLALPHYQRARVVAHRIGNLAAQRHALANLANAYMGLARWEQATVLLEEALGLAQLAGDPQDESKVLSSLASVHWKQGELKEAVALYERALAAAMAAGDLRGECVTLNNLGGVLAEQGQMDAAEERLLQALSISQHMNDPAAQMNALGSLAGLHRKIGQVEKAQALYSQQVQVAEEIGDQTRAEIARHQVDVLAGDSRPAEDVMTEGDAFQYNDTYAGYEAPTFSRVNDDVQEGRFLELRQSVEEARQSTNAYIHQSLPES